MLCPLSKMEFFPLLLYRDDVLFNEDPFYGNPDVAEGIEFFDESFGNMDASGFRHEN